MHESADRNRRPRYVNVTRCKPPALQELVRAAAHLVAPSRKGSERGSIRCFWSLRSLSAGLTAVISCAVIPQAQAQPSASPGLDLPLSSRIETVLSHVPLSFGVEVAWLRRQVAEHIPSTWREENRTIAPGTVADVTLTRGDIVLALERDVATMSMPVDMSLSVRSRLGTWVVPVGRCQSTIDVTVTASLRMNGDGALPLPTVRAEMREPCRLSALDVTPFLQREIDRQLERGQRHLIEWQSRQQAEFQRVRGEVVRRLETRSQSRIRFCPCGISQADPVLQDGILLSKFVIDGQVSKICRAGPFGVTVQTAAPPRPFDLVTVDRIAWSELGVSLAKHLATSGKAQSVVARSAHRDNRDFVALLIRTPKQHGWVLAQPEVSGRRGMLINLSADDSELLADLKPELDGFSFSVETADVEALSNDIVDELSALSTTWGNQPDSLPTNRISAVDLETQSDIRVDKDGLVLTTHRQNRISNPPPTTSQ